MFCKLKPPACICSFASRRICGPWEIQRLVVVVSRPFGRYGSIPRDVGGTGLIVFRHRYWRDVLGVCAFRAESDTKAKIRAIEGRSPRFSMSLRFMHFPSLLLSREATKPALATDVFFTAASAPSEAAASSTPHRRQGLQPCFILDEAEQRQHQRHPETRREVCAASTCSL